MTSKLNLDPGLVAACRDAAGRVARRVQEETAGRTTVSIERAVARLLGIDGVDADDAPLPNVIVDHVAERGGLGQGIAPWIGRAMVATGRTPAEIAVAVGAGELDLGALEPVDEEAARRAVTAKSDARMAALSRKRAERVALRERLGQGPEPLRYVLTATGNVYEDIVHGRAVAENGGDVVAITRSTAQSLLDFVPYGATTEGFGGTFATQENYRIMREAMDAWGEENGRYIRLSSFCSGLCMAEIATIGAMEGLDNLVNDALYGILYRDINPVRTLIDQRVSRMINGYFGIVINTGEDNYLRTADAVEAAPSVVASQLINYDLARASGVPDAQIALGDAFEIHPDVTNGLLYEWAQAQLMRELFPDCPTKYMPPTKHMDGNAFRTHANDTLFNLVTIATHQGIETIGMPTEGVYTPHLVDRVLGLENADYVFNFAKDLGDDIEFKRGGIVQTRAADVLRAALDLLERIAEIGFFEAIAHGTFGDAERPITGGRGAEGVIATDEDYLNPCVELMEGARV